MSFLDHMREFRAGNREYLHDRVRDGAICAALTAVAYFGWKPTLAGAILVGIMGAFVLRQVGRNAEQDAINHDLLRTQHKLTGLSISADDVLFEAAEADKIAAGAETMFRTAAERRVLEARYIAEHGRRDKMMTGTFSGTLEDRGNRLMQEWERRYPVLKAKLEALGFKVVVPRAPGELIAGEPTEAGTRLVCEREALNVALDALRHANVSRVPKNHLAP